MSRSRWEEFTVDVQDLFADLRGSWMGSLLFTVFFLPIVTVIARGLATVGLLIPGLSGALVVAVVLVLACAVQLGVFIVGVIKARPANNADRWRFANVLSALLSLGLYVETFAVVTVCVRRASGQPADAWGGLWRAESFYLWHLLDAIPVLDITDTVRWAEPAYAKANAPVGLLIAFQLLIIPQLLRAAIAGYRFAVAGAAARDTRQRAEEHGSRWWAPRLASGVVTALLVAAAAITVLAVQAADRESAFLRWWTGSVLPAVHADGTGLQRWATAAPAIVLLLAGFLGLFHVVFVAVGLSGYILPNTRSWWTTAMVLIAALAQIYGIMLWDAGLLLTLDRLEVGVRLPDTARTLTVVESLVWHVVHMLPGPDVARTLGWTAPIAIGGGVAGWVLLALKTFVVATIVFLGLPVVRTAVLRTRCGPIIDVWGAALAVSSRATPKRGHDDFWAFTDWGNYAKRREYLERAAGKLAAMPRFAELRPTLQAMLDALPTGERTDPATRAEFNTALLAFRGAVMDTFPEAAGAVAERPDWLIAQPDSDPVTRQPG